MHTYSRKTTLSASASEAFRWHVSPGAFDALKPPWVNMKVERHDGVFDGAEVILQLRMAGIPVRWHLRHSEVVQNKQFVDTQVSGPFKAWRHEHLFHADGARCILEDRISFELPLPIPFAAALIKNDLDRLFDFRASVLKQLFG